MNIPTIKAILLFLIRLIKPSVCKPTEKSVSDSARKATKEV